MRDAPGNLPPISGVFPDYFAAIRNALVGVRELALARWRDTGTAIMRRGRRRPSSPGMKKPL